MISITLPNKQKKKFPSAVSGMEIAKSISKSLAENAIAINVDNEIRDLSREIKQDANIEIITDESEIGLDILRHDTAHILAQAVKELYPKAKIAIGPTIKDGFYYDIDYKESFTPDDLAKIELHMHKIIKRNDKIIRELWSRNDAINFFTKINESYKVEIISALSEKENITLYRQGNFIDLCRGPHSLTTGKTKFFKLTKLAGSYWRGNSKNKMLQRIYGTAWAKKQDLDDYLRKLEEAEKRDHRKIARIMDLFHIQEEAQGSIFWHENGWILYRTLENYIREKLQNNGYVEVKTPIMLEQKLWEKSGHWEKFRENMFISNTDEKTLAIKPMNCPCHVELFNQHTRSYRDLPLRIAEFGMCHRNESSGSLHGLMRVRSFTQDDAHIFCTKDQITEETIRFCNLLKEVYRELGFTEIRVKFSDRPKIRAGTDETWNKAEESLKKSLESANIEYSLNPGEGAFYGPKLEFILKDAIDREWQCGTLQVDFILPKKLSAYYTGPDNKPALVVMLHRAILGTFERFIGILIEHYSGKFPLWLAPIQVVIATITDVANGYANKLFQVLKDNNIRATVDGSNQKISYKIRNYSSKKVPFMWVIGKIEMQKNLVSVRSLGSQEVQQLSINNAIKMLIDKIKER
ncbi:MAG: threonine--tRNA ligase [Rickettsiaceae bacterium H1]|nr:threonine--tRNA ligase [Rickettsiaceae bacterium H1]